MFRRVRAPMLLRILLISLCFAAPALADSDDCTSLRRTLTLAREHSVDTGELARLETQLCGRPTRAACEQLEEFWMLSVALREPQSTTSTLEAQRGVWCARDAEPTRALQWPDGTQLRSTSGMMSWPNGTMARSSSGSWSAPSGTLVRSSTGSLSFPSGSMARTSSGRWMLSTGEQTEEGRIASLACSNDMSWCRYFLGEANRGAGVMRDFALLGLALLANRN